MERGNVIFDREWEFWFIVTLQIISIVALPFAIHNVYSYVKEKKVKQE